MRTRPPHPEHHHLARSGWLRAAVLGANDGILSTASLILGVATATHSHSAILISGISGLVAGAFSMAAGEYVSVSSQSDTEKADIATERKELERDKEGELQELTNIYVERGLKPELAAEVAKQLSAHDALAAHKREELGITAELQPHPVQAAIASALSFSSGAALPVLTSMLVPLDDAVAATYGASLVFLTLLGAVGAREGGANIWKGAIRVTFWGAFAMAATAAIGLIFHTHV